MWLQGTFIPSRGRQASSGTLWYPKSNFDPPHFLTLPGLQAVQHNTIWLLSRVVHAVGCSDFHVWFLQDDMRRKAYPGDYFVTFPPSRVDCFSLSKPFIFDDADHCLCPLAETIRLIISFNDMDVMYPMRHIFLLTPSYRNSRWYGDTGSLSKSCSWLTKDSGLNRS